MKSSGFLTARLFSVRFFWISKFITSVFIKQYCFLVVYIILLEEVTISPTTESQGGWSINGRPIIPKKFLCCCENSRAHNRLPILGIQQRDWKSPENLTLKVSRVWLHNFQRTGATETLGWHKQNLVHTRTQEKGAMTLQETEPDLPLTI